MDLCSEPMPGARNMLEIHVPRPLAKLAWTFAPATRLIFCGGSKTARAAVRAAMLTPCSRMLD